MIELKTPRWMWGLALALGVLLPVLAALQYHWLDRLSEDEAARMRAALRLAADRFVHDVDGELARVVSAFTPAPVRLPEEAASELADRWKQWQASAPIPGLVAAVYWVKSGDDTLYRLETADDTLTAIPWPDEMAGWPTYVNNFLAQPPDGRMKVNAPDTLAGPPVLVVPVPSTVEEFAAGRTMMQFSETMSVVLVAIDENVLASAFFPALAEAYIAGGAEMPYQVAVVRRHHPSEVLYTSEDVQRANGPFERADLTMDFARVGWSPFRGHPIRQNVLITKTRDGEDSARIARSADARVVLDARVVDRQAVGIRQSTVSSGIYRLLIRHRDGSLEAAVTTAKLRNVAISFGILGLLGAAAALFFAAERRARQLAAQQATFVAGVSHELRTPLTVIRTAGENLADGVVNDSEQVRAYGRVVRDEGLRLTGLVDQVLELVASRSHSRERLALEAVPVEDVIEKAVESCRSLFSAEGVEIAVSTPPDLPPLKANTESLTTALRNLIVNAVKYRGSSSTIHIEAERAENATGVRIAVRDRGIGIPPDEVSKLFDPFFRGRQAEEQQIHGSGLGLSLVHRIAELHGGSVAVESEPGRGSTFTLNIPAANGSAT